MNCWCADLPKPGVAAQKLLACKGLGQDRSSACSCTKEEVEKKFLEPIVHPCLKGGSNKQHFPVYPEWASLKEFLFLPAKASLERLLSCCCLCRAGLEQALYVSPHILFTLTISSTS